MHGGKAYCGFGIGYCERRQRMNSEIANRINRWILSFGLDNRFAIWGCSDFAVQLIDRYRKYIRIEYVVDNDKKIQGTYFEGLRVLSPEELCFDKGIKIIISNMYMGTRVKISNQLDEMGFVENVDYTYGEIVFSVFNWLLFHKIASQYVEIPITTFCSLNCKNCTAYTPYVEKHHHLPFDKIAEETDLYFNVIDYAGRFRVLGGEPFLYPELGRYLEYIGKKYRNRIGELCVVTNGTIPIQSQWMSLIKQYDVTLFVSNYAQTGHRLASPEKYKKLLHILDAENVRYYFPENQKWLDLGKPEKKALSDTELKDRFSDCRHYCRSIVQGNLFMCATWAFATIGGIYKDDWSRFVGEEILDLRVLKQKDPEERFAELFRFDIEMSTQNGYLDFCQYCQGFGSKNTHFVPVGEQM